MKQAVVEGAPPPAGVTARLGDAVAAVRYAELPDDVVHVAKLVTFDGIANMLAGSAEPLGKILIEFVRTMGGVPTASVMATAVMTNPPYAAFANAAFCHALDYEAMWWPPTHPTSPVLPALLALSEQEQIPAVNVLEALVAGFEVQGRLNLMSDWIKDPYAYFHPPGSNGAIGSAAACAKLLGLDAWGIRMAMGIGASRASGLWANSGTMTKSQHSANAARAGVEAALLARAGYTSNEDVIEAKQGGFAKVFYGDDADVGAVVRDFGQPYRMVTPGLTIKKHPAQTTTHWCIDAALAVKSAHAFDPAEIDEVIVEVGNPNWSAQWLRPKSGLEGKFSIHYTVALALLEGRILIDHFTDERRFAPDIEALLGKIKVIEDDRIPPSMNWPETWAAITVRLHDGRTFSARCDKPKGRGDDPLSEEELLAKFIDCAQRALLPAAIAPAVELVRGFGELESARQLFAFFRDNAVPGGEASLVHDTGGST